MFNCLRPYGNNEASDPVRKSQARGREHGMKGREVPHNITRVPTGPPDNNTKGFRLKRSPPVSLPKVFSSKLSFLSNGSVGIKYFLSWLISNYGNQDHILGIWKFSLKHFLHVLEYVFKKPGFIRQRRR